MEFIATRPYYFNIQTNVTQWEKPKDMTGWKFVEDKKGKTYYYNAMTDETQWKMPNEYEGILKKIFFKTNINRISCSQKIE
jgi:hypothetical protein